MARQIVVGLYRSKGIAEDAVNRLRTEGVPDRAVSLALLKQTAPPPPTVQAELAALSADPMILGNVRDSYARFIRNGETVVLVHAEDADEAQLAADVLRLFDPLAVDVLDARPRSDHPGAA